MSAEHRVREQPEERSHQAPNQSPSRISQPHPMTASNQLKTENSQPTRTPTSAPDRCAAKRGTGVGHATRDLLHELEVAPDDRHTLDREVVVRQVVNRALGVPVGRIGRNNTARNRGPECASAVRIRCHASTPFPSWARTIRTCGGRTRRGRFKARQPAEVAYSVESRCLSRRSRKARRSRSGNSPRSGARRPRSARSSRSKRRA